MRFNLNCIIQCVSLPCFSNIPKSSIGSFSSEKIGHLEILNVIKVPKTLVLFVMLFFGTLSTFAQKVAVPDISASVSGPITCLNASVQLKGSSKTSGVYYSWAGPRGYSSTAQNPTTAIPGEYTLTVKDPINGGAATANVRVLLDTIVPKGVKVKVSGLLTCKDTLVTLTGSSLTSGVAYDWKGPKGYTSAMKAPVTATSGFYIAKVINPTNGCAVNASVEVLQNIVPPSGVSASTSGVLTCKDSIVTLTGISGTKGVQYDWSSHGFTSSVVNPSVSVPGTYQLKVTDPLNGCYRKTSVVVNQNKSVAEKLVVVSDTLTCKKAKATITVTSATKGLNYRWTGPNPVFSTESTLETDNTGSYSVTVSNPTNGCSITKLVNVLKDTIPPSGVNATVSGIISCKMPVVELKGQSSLGNGIYNWSGPQDFRSNAKDPAVKIPGTYSLSVTNPKNGCESKASAVVTGVACTQIK